MENPPGVGIAIRPIPKTSFLLRPFMLSVVIGVRLPLGFILFTRVLHRSNTQLLGASTIFMEVYYVFNAIWMYKLFCVWRPLLVSILMLVLVIGSSSVVATYFRLNEENYKWQWPSFIGPFGISGYLFLYGLYFYSEFYEYDGAFQLITFLLSSAALALTVGVICGFVGVLSALLFVKMIYRNLKAD
jgi:transmembrane 9 superfamily protein 2/4